MMTCQHDKRRIGQPFAKLYLLVVKPIVILFASVSAERNVRDNRSGSRRARSLFAAARASGNLRHQLKRPLGRAKIRQARDPISTEITPTSVTFGKSWPFGDHLRADEHIEMSAIGEIKQDFIDLAFV